MFGYYKHQYNWKSKLELLPQSILIFCLAHGLNVRPIILLAINTNNRIIANENVFSIPNLKKVIATYIVIELSKLYLLHIYVYLRTESLHTCVFKLCFIVVKVHLSLLLLVYW